MELTSVLLEIQQLKDENILKDEKIEDLIFQVNKQQELLNNSLLENNAMR